MRKWRGGVGEVGVGVGTWRFVVDAGCCGCCGEGIIELGVVLLVSVANFAGISTWFSTNAISGALKEIKGLSDADITGMTVAVQLGFVCGAILISLSNVADRAKPSLLFFLCALLAAASNLVVLWIDAILGLLFVRLVTGIALAGVYPISLRILSGWFHGSRGMALGLAVGALAIGSGLPYLVRSILLDEWELVLIVSSSAASLGGLAVYLLIGDGKHDANAKPSSVSPATSTPSTPTPPNPPPAASPRTGCESTAQLVLNPAIRFAFFGYCGHMMELYAMWTWIGVFLEERFGEQGLDPALAPLITFLAFFLGGVACPAAGWLADRFGRTIVTSACMLVSGSTAMWIGFLPPESSGVICFAALLWGVTIVPDSAQFSAAVAEVAPLQSRGVILTAYTGIGFLITIPFIFLVGMLKDVVGWGWSFFFLGLGPVFFGAPSMLYLRQLPDAKKIANGQM